MILPKIEQALKEGCRVLAYMSNSKIRIVRIDLDGTLKGYGEALQVEDALSYANKDLVECRHYRGSCSIGLKTASSRLDQWLLDGNTFDIGRDGEGVVFRLIGRAEVKVPAAVCDQVMKEGGSMVWMHRGYRYCSTRVHVAGRVYRLETSAISAPKGKRGSDAWSYPTAKTGRGADISQAMGDAFWAEPTEIKLDR